MTHAHAEDQG